jgi:ribosomal protein S27AE
MGKVVDIQAFLHCGRCETAVRPVRPWPHWRKVRMAYFGGLAVALCGAPVILADGFFMIPTLMLYMSAIGPINSFARVKPTCSRCSAVLQ